MTGTSRLPSKGKAVSRAVATGSGDIARQSRVEQLRRMVAAGQYQVDPYKLALKIMVKALGRNE